MNRARARCEGRLDDAVAPEVAVGSGCRPDRDRDIGERDMPRAGIRVGIHRHGP